MAFKGRPNTKENQETAEESQLKQSDERHDIGCPRYRLSVKAKRNAKSPLRSPSKLHPKPWGARDPKEIPCSCVASKKGTAKSAPSSRRQSPVRETDTSTSAKGRKSRARNTSNSRTRKLSPRDVVLDMFNKFCERASKIGAELTLIDLQNMAMKMNNTFLNINAVVKETSRSTVSLKTDKSVIEVNRNGGKDMVLVASDDSLNAQPSVIERNSNSDPNELVWVTNSEFPDQTIAFGNLIGSVIPVALGNNSFYSLDGTFQPALHQNTLVTFENTQAFLPTVPSPPRMPRSPNSRSPTRRHF